MLECEIPQIGGIVQPIFLPKDIWDRRTMIEEYKKIALPLWQVELDFYAELFSPGCTLSYDELYKFYNKEFQMQAAHLVNTIKPTILAINTDYFKNLFEA